MFKDGYSTLRDSTHRKLKMYQTNIT